MRCGRKRFNGHREPNGRLSRIQTSERERDPALVEKLQVLSQPHRRGDLDQLAESALGRFVIRNKLHRALFDAGLEWGSLVRHYHSAKLATQPVISVGFGSGAGVTPEKTAWLRGEVERIEKPLRRMYPVGFVALQTLAVYEREIAPEVEGVASEALCELGLLLRKIGKR